MRHVVVMTLTGALGLMSLFLVDLIDLFFLSGHPQLSVPMQTMVSNLRTRWQLEVENAADAAAAHAVPSPLWHAVPASVQ